jgi:xylulokinase
MLCFKNGALTRNRIRDEVANGSWKEFNALFESTKPGNDGKLGFYYDVPEITPTVNRKGVVRFNEANEIVEDKFPAAVEVRAMLESQVLTLRLHADRIGVKPAKILATGGASTNPQILQLLADVFGCSIYTSPSSESACLGAAFRALHAHLNAGTATFIPFGDVVVSNFELAASPRQDIHNLYTDLLQRFAQCEKQVSKELS